ncbi:Hint domain-containing protein [Pseudooceanicola sp. C21-150M6]|uniref:Hint domain-containing protein n=1 Tax=Pseudooceanicola sp. C21-150M6 TaxID=3434355 RepID=UPI003D7FB8A0
MATYTIAGYDASDIVIHSGSDPFEDDLSANGSANGAIFSVTSEPDTFTITDNDGLFDDGDGSQNLAESVTQDGTTRPAGADITPEYFYLVRPVGSTDPSEYFYVYAYDMDTSGRASGIVTEHRLKPGQQYQVINEGPTNDPSVAYSSLYVCFTAGTRIATPSGTRLVEDLRPGDLVRTAEGKCVPVRWTGYRVVNRLEMHYNDRSRPVRIAAGALGDGLPARDLMVSQQHRVMLRSKIVEKVCGVPEVLIAAKHLIGLPGITLANNLPEVCYMHLLVDAHRVLLAEDAPCESLYVGRTTRDILTQAQWKEVKTLIGDVPFVKGRPQMDPARPMVEGKKARNLVNRHRKNQRRPLVDPVQDTGPMPETRRAA